jgi:phosphoribosylformylglycinamidine cyclo-ligase
VRKAGFHVLDYLAVDKMRPEVVAEIVHWHCHMPPKPSGMALIGGESAELPGLYAEKSLRL